MRIRWPAAALSALLLLPAGRASADEAAARLARTQRAYDLLREKRWKEAVAELDALIEEDPSDARLRMERGYARDALGQHEAAADEFTAIAREPGELQAQAQAALKQVQAETTPQAQAITRDTLLDQAYEDLRKGRKKEAREKFRAALAQDPSRAEIAKQLAYMDLQDGDLHKAAAEFQSAESLTSDERTSLELGYVYDSLHDEAAAERCFAAAARSRDPRVQRQGESALRNIRGRSAPFYLDAYAAPYYDSRSSDKIVYAELYAGYKPHPDSWYSLYLGARDTNDSRSHSGAVPEIFTDDYASLAPGVRLQPYTWNASLTAEYGVAFNFIRSADHPHAREGDGRVVLSDYRYWGARTLFSDAGFSAGYYSRYRDNVIAYLQWRGGAKVWDDGFSQLSLYSPVNVYKDSNRDFFNNAVEFGAGAEFQPSTKVNLKARVEYLRGVYMGIDSPNSRNPYGPHYNDLRVTLVYSAHFTRRMPDAAPPVRRPRFSW